MERNSEGKATWIIVVGVIVTTIGALAAELLGAGLLEKWPIAVTIATAFVAIAKLVGDYTASRPGKHLAMVAKAEAEALAKKPQAAPDQPE